MHINRIFPFFFKPPDRNKSSKENTSVQAVVKNIFNKYLIPLSVIALTGASLYYMVKTVGIEKSIETSIITFTALKYLHLSFPSKSPAFWLANYQVYNPEKATFEDFKKKLPNNFIDMILGVEIENINDLLKIEKKSPKERTKWCWKKVQSFFKKIRFYSKEYGLSNTPHIAIEAGGMSGIAGALSGFDSSSVVVTRTAPIFFTNEDELDAVICHELSHVKHKDVFSIIPYDLITTSTYITALRAFSLSMPFLAICFSVSKLSEYISSRYTRRLEKRADIEAVEILGSAKSLTSFFKKHYKSAKDRMIRMEKGNLWQKLKRKIYFDSDGNHFMDTHPPLSERIKYLEEWEKNRIAKLPFYRRFFASALFHLRKS